MDEKIEPIMFCKYSTEHLKPFDKVLVRHNGGVWTCTYFSFRYCTDISKQTYKFNCMGINYDQCIPYNAGTLYLLMTSNNPQEYYNIFNNNEEQEN